MSRILVVGGYGGFGARLSRRLAAGGHQMLIAGRSRAKAEAFAGSLPGAEAVVLDRLGDILPTLERLRPDLVIDAAGPFQGSDYRVPQACVAARTFYVDLADARGFVCGIGELDDAARAAGVAIVSGASSVPALSGAAARHLASGLDRVSAVAASISASNRATAGPAVAAAILSYVGKPVRLWRSGRWQERTGWHELAREEYRVVGEAPLRRRLVALCDVPDHALLPASLPGRPAVTFRAGTELRFQMLALWLASWPVRWGWLRSLTGLAPWLGRLQRVTAGAGSDRSAMAVEVKGWRAGHPVTRRWTLLAQQGDGPEIPTLAAALTAEDLLAGRVAPGARDAAGLLTLERFEPLFASLSIRHQVEEQPCHGPLYRRVMGEDFDALPPLVRAMHEVHGDAGAAGEGQVRRGGGPLGRLLGAIIGFPPAGEYPVHVDFSEDDGRERWTRHFGPHRFWSRFSAGQGLLVERFGLLRFGFELRVEGGELRMRLRRWSALGLPLPLFLAPRVNAREWQEDDRFHFDDRIVMPLIGEVVHYSGWLRPVV